MIQSLAVYCGSSTGADSRFVEMASALGAVMAEREVRLVYGGGGVGLMGAVADAVLAGGGEVMGVIPQFLQDKELGHKGVTEMVVVETMHERKTAMMEYSDAFIALPGGYGTLEELFEVLAWSQLQLHAKPVGVMNVGGYYDGLLTCLDRMVSDGLLRQAERERLIACPSAEGAMDALAAWSPPKLAKWEDPEFWTEGELR